MQEFKFGYQISREERYLIDYANLIDKSLIFQKKLFENETDIKNFLKCKYNRFNKQKKNSETYLHLR